MKLYWRVKRNGSWTWRAVSAQFMERVQPVIDEYGIQLTEEEE